METVKPVLASEPQELAKDPAGVRDMDVHDLTDTNPMKVYLAGPEVFLPNGLADRVGQAKKALCLKYGFVGLWPSDNNSMFGTMNAENTAKAIYVSNLKLMDVADIIVANLTPFRGPSADVGTAYELGYMKAKGKIVAAYTNVSTAYIERVHNPRFAGAPDTAPDHMKIENFGGFDNLMLTEGLEVLILRDRGGRIDDLEAFEECLVRLTALRDRART